jgi:hypothetical protein
LRDLRGLLRLTPPVLAAVLGLALDDAYANPRRKLPLDVVRAPLVAIGLALACQAVLWAINPEFAVPPVTMVFGSVMSLLFSTGVRIVFPPFAGQFQGVNAPALWLKQEGAPIAIPPGFRKVAKGIVPIVVLLLAGLIAYRLWNPGAW